VEVGGIEGPAIDEVENETVDDGVAEEFQEVEGEGGTTEIGLMEEAEVGVEAESFEDGGEFVHHEGVAEREQGIERVGGGVFGAAGPSELRAIERHEGGEVEMGGGTFDAFEGGECGRRFEISQGLVQLVEGRLDRVDLPLVFSVVTQDGFRVTHFGGDDPTGEAKGLDGIGVGFELGDAEENVLALGHGKRATKAALAGEEADGDGSAMAWVVN
jgi:hypothetical protein